jgi:hypothetical protein
MDYVRRPAADCQVEYVTRDIRSGEHHLAMNDAALVGIVGLAASTVIALGQTVLANRRHAAQLRHDRALGDRAELRDVLDAAAQTLRRAMWAMDAVRAAFSAGDFEGIMAAGQESERLAQAAALDNGRIAMRLGRRHDVYVRHDEAMEVFIKVAQELAATMPTGVEKYLIFRRDPIAKRLELQMADAEGTFSTARGAFIDAAEKLVGSDPIPEDGRSTRALPRTHPLSTSPERGSP